MRRYLSLSVLAMVLASCTGVALASGHDHDRRHDDHHSWESRHHQSEPAWKQRVEYRQRMREQRRKNREWQRRQREELRRRAEEQRRRNAQWQRHQRAELRRREHRQHQRRWQHHDRWHDWRRGHRYTGHWRVVDDYGRYGLRVPPQGYHWIRGEDNGYYFLVATATRLILDIVSH